MATATVAQPTKAHKAYYAHLNSVEGALTKVDDVIYFFSTTSGTLTPVSSYAGLTVLGEIGFADTQRLMDDLHGGLARISVSRQNVEVR